MNQADIIAQRCERSLVELDLNKPTEKQLYNYNYHSSMLETFLRRNFLTFEVTDLVYTWCKLLCDTRINFENWYRSIGWVYNSRLDALKRFNETMWFYNKTPFDMSELY